MTPYLFFTDNPSFTPFWWEAAPRSDMTSTPLPQYSDIVIVGSGYAGLSAALTAAQLGANVLVLESMRLGEGASTRNGGAVVEGLRVPYRKMVRKFGQKAAVDYYNEARNARLYLSYLINKNSIKCRYRTVGRFLAAHRKRDYEDLARDLEARRATTEFDADMVPASEVRSVIGSDSYHGGRLVHTEGNLHPGLFHEGLSIAAGKAGATFSDYTTVFGLERTANSFSIYTSRGTIHAGQVIIATNGYTEGLIPWFSRRLIPIQSQIIATEPLNQDVTDKLIPNQRQMGDTRKLHNYFRVSPDGRRLLFGGRAGATNKSDVRKRTASLRLQMLDIFPELEPVKISYSWAGLIAYTFDSLPHITVHNSVHYVGGCCGSGVAMQPFLGHKVALKALGKYKESTTIFDKGYSSIPGYTGTPWFLPALISGFHFRDRFKI